MLFHGIFAISIVMHITAAAVVVVVVVVVVAVAIFRRLHKIFTPPTIIIASRRQLLPFSEYAMQQWELCVNKYRFTTWIYSSTHSFGMCRMQWFLAVLRSFFHSSLLYTLSFHTFPPTSLPFSLTLSCHVFLGLTLSLIVSKLVYNTFLGILFSSILYTCPHQCNLFKLTVSVIVGVLTIAYISLLINILQFSFSLSYAEPKILLYTFLSKTFICFLSLFGSIQVSDAYVKVLSIIVFFSLNISFLDIFLFLKHFCCIKYVLLAFFILSSKSIWWLLSELNITPTHLKFKCIIFYC